LSIGLEDTADVAEEMFGQVQYHLSSYPGAIQVVDNAPRASDYVTEFRMLKEHADALTSALQSANARILGSLEADLETDHATTLDAVQTVISTLSESASHMIAKFGADLGGRPKLLAQRLLIDHLCKIFETYYRGPDTGAGRRGTMKQLTDQQAGELNFLRVALVEAGIKLDGHKLRKMLLSRCQDK
jgi:hypothetical protein